MDPITVIVTALATGAAAGVGDTAKVAIKDAYGALKRLVQNRYGTVPVATLEKQPESKANQAVVQQELGNTAAGSDVELLRLAQVLIDLIREHAPEAAEAAAVSIKELEAQSLYVSDIQGSGPGVILEKSKIGGKVEIKGVRGGRIRSKG
jgi:hypothetical protein